VRSEEIEDSGVSLQITELKMNDCVPSMKMEPRRMLGYCDSSKKLDADYREADGILSQDEEAV
jgi:hypothetical protein